jgi:hypothetical protein
MERGATMLGTTLAAAAGVSIAYTRGNTTLTISGAIVGQTIMQSEGDTAIIEWRSRDYIVPASALGALGEPARGDRIAETIRGTARQFEVLPDADRGNFSYCDSGRTLLRIRTKEVG